MVIQKLGGGTYNLSLSAVITKAAGAESAGGASTAFNASLASGSAVVSINPEEEISVTCYGPNCGRIFDRIVAVEILVDFAGC